MDCDCESDIADNMFLNSFHIDCGIKEKFAFAIARCEDTLRVDTYWLIATSQNEQS